MLKRLFKVTALHLEGLLLSILIQRNTTTFPTDLVDVCVKTFIWLNMFYISRLLVFYGDSTFVNG